MKKCANCPDRPPKLFPENIKVWELWNAACTQWRTSFGGVVGLDYTAVDMNPATIRKLKKLETYELERLNKQEEDDGKK